MNFQPLPSGTIGSVLAVDTVTLGSILIEASGFVERRDIICVVRWLESKLVA